MAGRIVGLPGTGAWAMLARRLLAGAETPGFSPAPFSGRLVLVLATQEEIEDVADAFAALAPLFEAGSSGAAVFGEDERGRLASLELLRGGARLIVTAPDCLRCRLPAPAAFASSTLHFKIGPRLRRDDAAQR